MLTDIPTIKFSNQKPAIYDKAAKQFGVEWDSGTVFTFGNTIHSQGKLSNDLIVHESIHIQQQTERGLNKWQWWDKYFADPEFRKSQEVEAYQAQMKFIRRGIKDRNELARIRVKLANDMVKMYGGVFEYGEALKLLK